MCTAAIDLAIPYALPHNIEYDDLSSLPVWKLAI